MQRWGKNFQLKKNLFSFPKLLSFQIDSRLGHVVMGTQTMSPYQMLIEKTKALSFRSQMLQVNVEKKKRAQEQPNWGTDTF